MNALKAANYSIYFKEDATTALNDFIAENNFSKLFVLVDENTNKHCLPLLLQKVATNATIEIVEIEAGEIHKNLDTCTNVWETLTYLGADRKSLLVNLGGGVITDLGGFVASAYKRGIQFINIPTTLLGMVDAAVGGKTGVDLGNLKNQIGLFSNPKMVLIHPVFLETLPARELRAGLAEIIKYSLTYNIELLEEVNRFDSLNISELTLLIYRAIEIKNSVVLQDPTEAGLRKVLNFGHTLGHAIESHFLVNKGKVNVTHGEAVAVGMVTACYISHKKLGFPLERLTSIKENILRIYGRVNLQEDDYPQIMALLKHDKKNESTQVNFVLLSDIAQFELDCKVNKSLIIAALNYYMA